MYRLAAFLTLLGINTANAEAGRLWQQGLKPLPSKQRNGSTGKIVGGDYAPNGEYPWFVSSQYHECGASLISSKHVLTAAHCADAFQVGMTVQIGDQCRGLFDNNCKQPYQERTIKKWIPHPQYKETLYTLTHDFAILTLEDESTMTPVELDMTGLSHTFTREKKNLWVAGYGVLEQDGNVQPTQIKHVEKTFVEQRICAEVYYGLSEDMFCAADPGRDGDLADWEDSCQGDSGGPLLDKDNQLLIGVVSFGQGCASPGYPGVYARISDEANWIKDTVCADYSLSSSKRPEFCNGIGAAATPSPTPVVEPWCSTNETSIEFELTSDSYPEENSVIIKHESTGTEVKSLTFDKRVSVNTYRGCYPASSIEDACFKVTVRGANADGIFVPGGFRMFLDNKEVIWEYGNSRWGQKTYYTCSGCSRRSVMKWAMIPGMLLLSLLW